MIILAKVMLINEIPKGIVYIQIGQVIRKYRKLKQMTQER